jgi:hypothetical protein
MLVLSFLCLDCGVVENVDINIPVSYLFQCEELISCIVDLLSALELGVGERKEFGSEGRGKLRKKFGWSYLCFVTVTC